MKFKVARADRGWKIFVGIERARASPGGRQFAKRISACGPSQDGPWVSGRSWATWPPPLSYLLTTWELAICLQISCNASSRFNARGFLSAGVFFEAKRFLGLLRPPTSSNHFVDLPSSSRDSSVREPVKWLSVIRVDAFDRALFSCTFVGINGWSDAVINKVSVEN